MGRVIVNQFVSLDGIVTDPDGSAGTAAGGWAFQHGPGPVSGDKFRLGSILETGVMLYGRTTWELLGGLLSVRDDDFSVAMTKIAKIVVSSTLADVSGWNNSQLARQPITELVPSETADRDVVVVGSLSIVRALQAADLVDEYRLMTFPTIVGSGEHLFDTAQQGDLELVSVDQVGPAVLTTYRRSEHRS
ncbi:dihydrofolate reductase family protein [Kribbella sp. NPDC058245]|uniref:dihydrofolate reductase family protein n=1 Tax=Kribbella sp. NPDC058245 TaxID=3346399 RepID=UPI0036EDC8E8